MRIFNAPFWAAALVMFSGPALAQEMYPGQSVTVNPEATGSTTLLYPGGTYMRLQRPLLQPYERQQQAPIQLHMPGSRRTTAAKPKPAASEAKAPEPTIVAEPKPAPPKPVAEAKPKPEPRPAPPPQKQVARTEPARMPAAQAAAAPDEMAGWNKTGLIEFLPSQGEVAEGRMD